MYHNNYRYEIIHEHVLWNMTFQSNKLNRKRKQKIFWWYCVYNCVEDQQMQEVTQRLKNCKESIDQEKTTSEELAACAEESEWTLLLKYSKHLMNDDIISEWNELRNTPPWAYWYMYKTFFSCFSLWIHCISNVDMLLWSYIKTMSKIKSLFVYQY